MISYGLNRLADVAPAIANHLWQSTVFAAVAAALTLVLRRNQARARHWVWMAASVKFLVPFALLIGMVSSLAKPRPLAPAQAGVYVAMEAASQPFTPAASRSSAPARRLAAEVIPAVCGVVWLGGFAGVMGLWCVRWRRVAAAMRDASPLDTGREAEALRRLERAGGLRRPIELRLSAAAMEPGVFGILRPVLAWPERISARLDDAHLEAVLAHEVCHVQRRDNLTAALHMLVEAVFWFHPLVWWMGGRLVEERERACDEEVLLLCGQPRVYAESILRVCEFCVESPLACVSGVTGADLKQRIVQIMTARAALRLDAGKKLLLLAAGVAAIGVPLVLGQANLLPSAAMAKPIEVDGKPIAFDVVSVKRTDPTGQVRMRIMPDGVSSSGVPLKMLIANAYGVRFDLVSGLPSWADGNAYDIEAKEDPAVAAALSKLSNDERSAQMRLMMQAMLAERFQLKVTRVNRELPVYDLVVAKGGPKLKETDPNAPPPAGMMPPGGPGHGELQGGGMVAGGPPRGDMPAGGMTAGAVKMPGGAGNGPDGARPGMMRMSPGGLDGQGVQLSMLVNSLAMQLGRTVIDKTGLTGRYDFALKYAPEIGTGGGMGPHPMPPDAEPDASGPSVFTALEEQLGLKLESAKGPVESVVVDHVEKPSEN